MNNRGLRGVKVGDPLYTDFGGRPTVLHVTEIGRRWVTCGWNIRFDVETGRSECGRAHASTAEQHAASTALADARKRLDAVGVELRYRVPADLAFAIDKLVAEWGKEKSK